MRRLCTWKFVVTHLPRFLDEQARQYRYLTRYRIKGDYVYAALYELYITELSLRGTAIEDTSLYIPCELEHSTIGDVQEPCNSYVAITAEGPQVVDTESYRSGWRSLHMHLYPVHLSKLDTVLVDDYSLRGIYNEIVSTK